MWDPNFTENSLQDLQVNSDTFLEELQKVVTECEPSCIICYKLIIQLRHHTTRTHSITTQDQNGEIEDPSSHSEQTIHFDQNQNLRRSSRNRKKINYTKESRTLLPETTKFTTEDTPSNISTLEDSDIKCEDIELDDPLYYPNEEIDDKSNEDEEKETHAPKIGGNKKKKTTKSSRSFRCRFCRQYFPDSLELNNHYSKILLKGVEDYENCSCILCGEKIASLDFTNHLQSNHKDLIENPYKCTICDCDKSFPQSFQLLRHLEQIHPTRLHFVCKICDKRFPGLTELNSHILVHGSDNKGGTDAAMIESDEQERLFGCNICKRPFKSNKNLRDHLQEKHKHLITLEYSCRICNEKFFAHIQLTRHFKKSHEGEKAFQCKDCNKQFKEYNLLSDHSRVHTGEKIYSCTRCTKSFRTKTQLNRHSRVHTREKRYGCDECGKYFGARGTLVIHKRIHTGEKPYMCEECSKCFSSRTFLNVHKKIHAEEGDVNYKRHVCEECGKRFTTRSGLMTHSVTHSKKKPHQCEECGKCFALPHQLRAHSGTHSGK